MDYLEQAKKALEQGTDMTFGEIIIANALIALVEYNQGQMIATSKLVNEVVGVQNSLDRLVEEHRKANELHSLFEEYMNKESKDVDER